MSTLWKTGSVVLKRGLQYMKYLLLLMLLLVGCSKKNEASEWDKDRAKALTFAKALKAGDCFRTVQVRKPEFSFEKEYTFYDHISVILYATDKALLIAQPHPECTASKDDSQSCVYWFRTISLSNLYLVHHNDVKVDCGVHLALPLMLNRLKESDAAQEYNLEML